MKLIHLSDLHLGKRVNEFSMIEDQKYILIKILNIIDEEKPDVIIIAGDIYDKSVPTVEAVSLFDDFLTNLLKRNLPVLVISGNHDSAERLSFGNKIMEASNIHIASAFSGNVEPIVLNDKFGPVNFYLLPFIKPSMVRQFFEDEKIESYTDAMSVVIKNMNIDKSQRNVLVAHQFVTGASKCESEEISVGGLDNIDGSVFSDFDYVALGHIHGPQNVGSEKICYCGTPLKYSFSECNHKKGVKVVELLEKENEKLLSNHKMVPLKPLHDMRIIKGKYDDLMLKKNYENTNTEDYIQVVLTDEDEIFNGFSKLQTVYKNIMKLEYDNTRTQQINNFDGVVNTEDYSPLELFQKFYKQQNNKEMTEEQIDYVTKLMESIWEAGK